MVNIALSGQLVCDGPVQAAIVSELLPSHLALTRAETGCLVFDVEPTADALVWQVDELFQDAAAFRAHQVRVSSSEWGRGTAHIERRFTVTGL